MKFKSKLVKKVCVICKKEFETTARTKKYCSAKCKMTVDKNYKSWTRRGNYNISDLKLNENE